MLGRIHPALLDGRRVRTGGGVGRIQRRRVDDLILPTGELSIGYPGDGVIDRPSAVHPRVDPGRYPVFISHSYRGDGGQSLAFVSVMFSEETSVRWASAGDFFTDSGSGCIHDRGLTDRLVERIDRMSPEERLQLRRDRYAGKVVSLTLDEASGGNALLFKTLDWQYDCSVGHDAGGRPACLVIDGRWRRWWDWLRFWD